MRASGKMLEAWKRISPAVHYTPLPFSLFVLFIDRMLELVMVECALLTWTAYHCLLRPGEALAVLVGDVVLPTLDEILQGVPGMIQIRFSKKGVATRLAHF